MDDIKFNYQSVRSEKARISVKFNKTLVTVLHITMPSLLLSGLIMVICGLAIGWAFIGLSVIPAMIVEWYVGELRHLAVSKDTNSIDDILSGEVLGRLSKKPTPIEIALIASTLPSGHFFAVRFGIGSSFLRDLIAGSNIDTQMIWKKAQGLMNQTGSRNVSAAILIVALIECSSNYRALLSHLQLDIDDLISGIKWYDYLRDLIDRQHVAKRTGGLARDWSFGWTPLLDRFGSNISQQMSAQNTPLIQLAAHNDALEQLMQIFNNRGKQNAILVGPSGVGKTEIINAFASRLLDASAEVSSDLKFRQVFILDAVSLIAAAPDRGGLEQLIPQILVEAYNAKNIIICLDNAQLFFEDGVGSVDISNVLLPILEAGNLRMILTMDEQRYLQIGKRNPALINALNRISVAPATREETFVVMEDRSIVFEFQSHVTYMYQSFAEAYRLGERYVYDLAMPGKALKILEAAANYSENGLVTAKSVRQSIEKTLGIKVGVATDSEERDKLLNLESLIHERMINQTRAVKVVSDALRRARAGVRNQKRPIGTFLFLGPTGVGKTELAKALADIYFGGEDHIVRLDMNEYVDSDDVKRLIADGADNANSLTARIMKQPFSIVLLDEIEKAHPNVLSTLLQMLDEGILRDSKNHEVSFRDAIIIATSNAGANRIREYIERGYDIEQFEDKFVDELIDSKQFRPEFLNRFDEIVVFRPLNKSELLQVVDLMLADVNKTLAVQKISVRVADGAKEYLVEAGYDPRLGARPMRRIVQRAVENIVAEQMLAGSVEPGSVIEITLEQVKHIIESKNSADKIIEDTNTD